jgi:MFS family permease
MTERRVTVTAIINQAVHWFTLGMVIPVFAAFQLDRGVSLSGLGLHVAILSGVVAVMELPTGGLADTLGRRNTYLVSLGFQFLAMAALAVSFSRLHIILGLSLSGIGRALSSGCMDAYFIDAHNELPEKGPLQRLLARIGVAIPLSLAGGGILGGELADIGSTVSIHALPWDRYSLLFLTAACVVVVQTVLTLLLIPGKEESRGLSGLGTGFRQIPTVFRVAVRHGLSHKVVLFLLLGAAMWGVAFSALEQYWQPYVNGITVTDSPTRLFGLLTGGYFLVGALGAAASGALFRLIGPRYAPVVAVLRVGIGVLFMVLGSIGNISAFAAIYFLLFFLNGVASSPEQTLLNENVPSEVRSTILSFESLFLQVGGGVAALLWGVLAEAQSISLAWRLGGGLFLSSALLYLVVARRLKR